MAGMDYPASWGPITDPVVKKWWDSQSADNKKSWNVHAGINNNNHPSTKVGWKGDVVTPGGPGWRGPSPKQTPTSASGRAMGTQDAASKPAAGTALSYQSGVHVGPAIDKKGVLSGLLATGNQPSPDVSAFSRATAMNDASQLGRAIDSQNQSIQMNQQARRSESVVAGASNLAKIYGDMAERGISQTGLAAQIAANNIGFAGGLQAAFNWRSAPRDISSAYAKLGGGLR